MITNLLVVFLRHCTVSAKFSVLPHPVDFLAFFRRFLGGVSSAASSPSGGLRLARLGKVLWHGFEGERSRRRSAAGAALAGRAATANTAPALDVAMGACKLSASAGQRRHLLSRPGCPLLLLVSG